MRDKLGSHTPSLLLTGFKECFMRRILVIAGMMLAELGRCGPERDPNQARAVPAPAKAKPLNDDALDKVTAGTVSAGISNGVVKFQGQTPTPNGLVSSTGSLAVQSGASEQHIRSGHSAKRQCAAEPEFIGEHQRGELEDQCSAEPERQHQLDCGHADTVESERKALMHFPAHWFRSWIGALAILLASVSLFTLPASAQAVA